MKHILAPILLLVFLFPTLALSEEVTLDDLVERKGLYYKKFTDVPFSGKVTGGGQGEIKSGKREGPWVSYFENGQLDSKGTWKNGKEEGPWVGYFDNGQIETKGNFKDGLEEGPWVQYYDNGQLYWKGEYKNGKKEGPWESYNDDGQSDEFTGTYKNDVKID